MPEFQRMTAKQRSFETKFTALSIVGTLFLGATLMVKLEADAYSEKFDEVVEYMNAPKGDAIDIDDIFVSNSKRTRVIYLEDDADIDTVKEEVIEEEPIVKYDSGYTSDFYDINTALYDYTSKYASFTFHDVQFDGLAVMAQANTESFYMCDPSISLSAIYPSRWLDMSSLSDIEDCNCAYVWAWGGLDGAVKAWSTGGGINEQGPLQQRVPVDIESALVGSGSEYDILKYSGLLDDIQAKCPEIIYNCTGTSTKSYNNVGDRFNVRDNCIIWKYAKEKQLDILWDRYYSAVDYSPNLYEYLAISAYSHWVPGIISGDNVDYQFYGFGYDNAWFDIAHALASDRALEIIRERVKTDITEHRAKYYNGELSEEAMLSSLQLVLYNSADETGMSEPEKIWNQLVEEGILDNSMIINNCTYGYDHARNYAIQYLYAYIALDELLMNRF